MHKVTTRYIILYLFSQQQQELHADTEHFPPPNNHSFVSVKVVVKQVYFGIYISNTSHGAQLATSLNNTEHLHITY